jgi:hypothetical protein
MSQFQDDAKQAEAGIVAYLKAHPKVTAVLIALVVGVVVGAYLFRH